MSIKISTSQRRKRCLKQDEKVIMFLLSFSAIYRVKYNVLLRDYIRDKLNRTDYFYELHPLRMKEIRRRKNVFQKIEDRQNIFQIQNELYQVIK